MAEGRVIGHSLLLRGGVLVGTAAVVLLNSRVLGAEGQGQVAVFQLGLLLISAVSGFIAGGTVVYLNQHWPLRSLWRAGHQWMAVSALAITAGFAVVGGFPLWGAIGLAGWLQAGIVFHGQILLATGAVRAHNRLAFTQTALLATFLLSAFMLGWRSLEGFVAALILALAWTAGDAAWRVRKSLGPSVPFDARVWSELWRLGRSAQTGALLQLLTNRLPFTWLARLGASGAAVAGLFSIAFYGMEAMWTAARALAPVLHARTAGTSDRGERLASTRAFALLTAGLAAGLWSVAMALPEAGYARAFGVAGIREVLAALGPAVLAGSVAGLLSHHLSGIGQHRWNAWTSGAGLVAVVVCGALWYAPYGAVGAAAAASVAGGVQVVGLAWGLHREERMRLAEWMPRRSDWHQLRANKSVTPIKRDDSNPSA